MILTLNCVNISKVILTGDMIHTVRFRRKVRGSKSGKMLIPPMTGLLCVK